MKHRILLLAVSLLLLSSALFAQTGTVDGLVGLPNHSGPAVGATVTLFHGLTDSLTTVTDDSGHFVFSAVPQGRYHARAVLAGYNPAMGNVQVREGRTAHLNLILRPIPTGLGNLAGVVVLPNRGGPAVGAAVTVYHLADSLTAITDDSGRFVFNGIPVGRYHARAVLAGYNPAMGNANVMDGQTARIMLVLRPIPTGLGNLAGVVVLPNRGGPAVGAAVTVYHLADSLTAITDDSGRFVFNGIPVGRYHARAVLAGYNPAVGDVGVMDGQTARIALVLRPLPTGLGNIAGVVQLPNHAGPAVGALVTVFHLTDSLTVVVDDSGRFAFNNVPVGPYRARADLAGYNPALGEARVLDGQTARLPLVLRAIPTGGGFVNGLVTLPDNTPVARAAICLFGEGNRPRGFHTASDSLGHFVFNNIPAGVYTINAALRTVGFATAQVTVVEGETVQVTLVLGDSIPGGPSAKASPLDAEETAAVPTTDFVATNYPNPFNPTTTISYSVPMAGNVSLAVYDITGRKVADLVNGFSNAGNFSVSFNGETLPSGMYFYHFMSGGKTMINRMILLK